MYIGKSIVYVWFGVLLVFRHLGVLEHVPMDKGDYCSLYHCIKCSRLEHLTASARHQKLNSLCCEHSNFWYGGCTLHLIAEKGYRSSAPG